MGRLMLATCAVVLVVVVGSGLLGRSNAEEPSGLPSREQAGFGAAAPLASRTSEAAVDIGDFWNHRAHFEFISANRFPTTGGAPSTAGMNVGFYFVPRPPPAAGGTSATANGTWYLFHREYAFGPKPAYCKYDYARIVVRTSTDEGRSWSNATVVVEPVPGTATECANVDGAAMFDEATQTWHYLGQCLARDVVWRMCHFTRAGADPRGLFTPDKHNPVVTSGQLWGPICAGGYAAGKHCPGTGMGSEGTPDIVRRDADTGHFYVTFHGWDPSQNKSARGVARTADWVTWETGGAGTGLPGDALFSSADCDPWAVPGGWAPGGCVGGGEGSMLAGGAGDPYLYQLIEAPDISLACYTQPGRQNWVLGLLRARGFNASTQWQQFAPNAAVVPATKQGCYIQYHRLFRDPAPGRGVYLEFWADNWMQLFKLVPGAGPLPIVAGPPPSADASPASV